MDEKKYEIPCYEEDETEISLLDILLIIAEGKKVILSFFLIFLLAGLGYGIFLKKPEYASSMQIAPITSETKTAGEFNVLVRGDLVAGILKSQSVIDSIIDDNDLLKNKDGTTNKRDIVRKSISAAIDQQVDQESGLVTVTVKDLSPERARNIAQSVYEATKKILTEIGIEVSVKKDSFLLSEIEKSLVKLEQYKREGTKTTAVKNDLEELMKALSLFSVYEEGAVYRKSAPMVVQLVSPPTLPDQPLPRGRGKIAALSGILGLFVGLTFAFISHFLRVSSSDPETAEKVKRLKELAGFKRERAN